MKIQDRGTDRKSRAAGSGQAGFTLVEMVIALFITGIVATAIYAVYNNYYRQSTTQTLTLEAQQNARVALNIMEREMMNAGYAAGTADIITEATGSSIEFIYSDPETDSAMSATAGNRLKVKYWLQTASGVQYLVKKVDNLTTASTGSTLQVIPNAQSLTLTYYNMNGDEVTDTSTQANRNTVKFVTVRLTTETADIVPISGAKKTFTVETHIRLRNIGIGQTALDTTAPSAPSGVQVRDPGLCARLNVKWTQNTEGDVRGYKVYYGGSTGNYTGVINIPLTVLSSSTYSCTESGPDLECSIYPSSPPLDSTMSDAAGGSTYFVAVKAYDNSLNHSNYSVEVSGNPDPSNPVFDSGSDDSTLNPVKPAAVTGLIGADGAAENTVALSWDTYDTSANPDVVGFRVYRSTSAFTSYPIDPSAADIDWIAGEPDSGKPELGPSDTTYTDTTAGLVGCKTYYYAIAPVNCDATLITDEGGDADAVKYVQADYDATCGNGTDDCTAGTGFSAVSGSDTAPNETTGPNPPTDFNARAGWKRVAVSFTQPSDSDLDQTCVYSQEGSSFPNLQSTKDALACYDVDNPGIRLFESEGVFDTIELAQSQSTSFWHNSMTAETSVPSLMETGTYSYRAVAFDLCGNSSSVTGAQATTTLCGEDPVGKPPAVTGLVGETCQTPVTLTWTGVSSNIGFPSSDANPWDLAGYRIVRSTSSSDWSGAEVLNSTPWWGTGTVTFNDSNVDDGGTYFYRVVTTDCPYEKDNPSNATIIGDMGGVTNYAQTGPITPGMLDRDEKCPGVGSCTKDNHREVLTGVNIDNTTGTGTGVSSIASGFTHDTVTMFIENTSAGAMTITAVSAYWVNSSAVLDRVFIGGGRSGVGRIESNIGDSLTVSTTNDPYTRALPETAITPTQISAGARYVPMTFKFEDSSDNPVDMRDDQILVTLTITNDSTGVTTCTSYLTVSKSEEGISVPLGPSITATQQNRPSSPTFSRAVPGATGLNTVPNGSDGDIVIGSNLDVTISASIAGNTTSAATGLKVPVSGATLYYVATAKTVTTAPASGFTAVAMTNISGNTWAADIPSNNSKRVWFYIVAVDDDGNFDRDPEIGNGAYVYDQKDFDVCDVTPEEPTSLVASATGTDVSLTWTAPTTYTSGSTIDTGLDTIKYKVFRGGSVIASDVTTASYSDLSLTAGVYSYNVQATNSCASPGPNVSDSSNTAAVCVDLSSQATIDVTPTTIYQGDSYDVTIVDCLAVNAGYATTLETLNVSTGFTGFNNTSTVGGAYAPTVPETGVATGEFPVTIQTTSNVAESGKVLVGETDTITVYYPYATPTSKTISVVPDPCSNTPKAPASLSGSTSGQNVDLSWSAVTLNTDDSAIVDLSGYRVYERVCEKDRPNCTGSDVVADWFVRTTMGSGTTSTTLSADQGPLTQKIYYFKVVAIDSCSTPNESADSPLWNE